MSLLSLSKKILTKQDDKAVAKKKTPKKAVKKTAKPADLMLAKNIGLQVITTEKSIGQHELNKMVVRVLPHATKHQIALAVKEKFGVLPLSVRTSNFQPKARRRGATAGRTRFWKKAFVTVTDIHSVTSGP